MANNRLLSSLVVGFTPLNGNGNGNGNGTLLQFIFPIDSNPAK